MKIAIYKGSGKRSRVREKSVKSQGIFFLDMDIEWQPWISQVLLAGGQVFFLAGGQVCFLWNLPFLPYQMIDLGQNE